MNYTKVLNYDVFVRDNCTGAIINTDKSAFEEARKLKNGSSSIKKLQSDVEELKNELSEIKNLLRELIQHGS